MVIPDWAERAVEHIDRERGGAWFSWLYAPVGVMPNDLVDMVRMGLVEREAHQGPSGPYRYRLTDNARQRAARLRCPAP